MEVVTLEPRSDPHAPVLDPVPEGARRPRVSVIISTFNRADALAQTLERFEEQTLPSDEFEVVVVDDGSTDRTARVLSELDTSYRLIHERFPVNAGVSAGRNAAFRLSAGHLLVLVSDDVLVPPDFLELHIASHERHPRAWIVGRFSQLDDLSATPFGRYLHRLEDGFDEARKGESPEPGVWELKTPTARNLSIPRSDLERIGLFDERFRTTCEDQDLAHRAELVGIRFLYDESISCVHNDQAADLARYCSFMERGAYDTELFCRKHADIHGSAEIVVVNARPQPGEGALAIARKLAKRLLATGAGTTALHAIAGLGERLRLPRAIQERIYRLTIGAHIQRGWARGERDDDDRNPVSAR
jgi:GT2 family glycosyltransferase